MKKVLFCSVVLSLLVGSFNVASAIVLGGVPDDLKQNLQTTYQEKKTTPEMMALSEEEKNKKILKELQKKFGESLKKAREESAFLGRLGFDKVKPSITLPAFKIYKSKKEHTIADVSVMSGIGGGISFVRYDADSKVKLTNGDPDVNLKTSVTFSPITILLRKEADKGSIDLSYAMTAGFFNDILMLGVGYDFGEVHDRNRLFILLSIGANF